MMRTALKLLLFSDPVRHGIINSDNEAALMTTVLGTGVLGAVNGTAAQSTARAVSGTKCYRYTVNTASNVAHYAASLGQLNSLKSYRFTGNVYVPTGSVTRIRMLDTSDGSWTGLDSLTKDAWIPFDVTRQPKGGATPWNFGLGYNGLDSINGQVIDIDDFQIYER